ncbi:MAG: hypothetical protein ABGZ35_00155, partial [Planctomycetaceae bacterium]
SAAKGLKPGSRGFCTVVSTAGMAKNLAERLESLSGYRHQFMPHEAGENPVNHSHVRLTVGGKKYHVISRVCDAGLDYTKRTNKLAHHIALTEQEVAKAPGGPAWVASSSKFLIETWDGKVQTLPESYRTLTAKPCLTGKCSNWASLNLDPGWAGALAETAIKKSQPTAVIFATATDTLALVRDALAVVPSNKRWQVTFSTYFTKLPAGVDCLWRFVLDGTQEAKMLRRNSHARVIDLCDPSLGLAPESELVKFARTGKATQPVQPPVVAESTITPSPSPEPTAPKADVPFVHPMVPSAETSTGISLEDESEIGRNTSSPPARTRSKQPRPAAMGLRYVLMGVVFGALMAFVAISLFLLINRNDDVPSVANSDPVSNSTDDSEAKSTPFEEGDTGAHANMDEDTRRAIEAAQRENRDREKRERADREKRRREDEMSDPKELRPDVENPPPVEEDVHDDPFEDIIRLNKRLKLPTDRRDVGQSKREFQHLAKLYVDDLSQCDIVLRGSQIDSEERNVSITPIQQNETKSWKVTSIPKKGISVKTEVGTFRLDANDSFEFKWGDTPKISLQLCLLDITVSGKTQTCSLVNPRVVKPIQMEFDTFFHRADLELVDDRPWRLEVWFEGEGFGEVKNPQETVGVGGTAKIRIPNPKGIGKKKFIEIEVKFDTRDGNCSLYMQSWGYPRYIKSTVNKVREDGFGSTELAVPDVSEARTMLSIEKLNAAKQLCRRLLDAVGKSQRINKGEKQRLKDGKLNFEAQIKNLK